MRSPCVRESAAPWSLKDLCGVYKYPQNICLEYEWSCLLVLYALNQRRVFFFNDTAPTEFYPLSLHDAFPISRVRLHYHRSRREVARLGDLINLIRQGGP